MRTTISGLDQLKDALANANIVMSENTDAKEAVEPAEEIPTPSSDEPNNKSVLGKRPPYNYEEEEEKKHTQSVRERLQSKNISAEYKNFRENEELAEFQITKALRNTLFPRLIDNNIITDAIVENDSNMQKRGVDVYFTLPDGSAMYLDLKAKTSQINRPTKTNGAELRYTDSAGHRVDGWLIQTLNGEKDTTHFAFISLNKVNMPYNDNRVTNLKAENIVSMDVIIVDVNDLKNFFTERYYTVNDLIEGAKEAEQQFKNSLTPDMSKEAIDARRRIYPPEFNGAYYYVSAGKKGIHTDPTTIVFPNRMLQQLPHSHTYAVHRKGIPTFEIQDEKVMGDRLPFESPKKSLPESVINRLNIQTDEKPSSRNSDDRSEL